MRLVRNNYYEYFGSKTYEPENVETIAFEENGIIREIFAPNPLTGWPSSALSLVLNPNTAREIQEFVKANLVSPLPPRSGADSDNLAFDSIKNRNAQFGTEIESYYQRLSEIVNNESSSVGE